MRQAPRVEPVHPQYRECVLTQDDDAPVNEITAAAHDARRCREGAAGTIEPGKARKWPLATIGIGIGSAALAAALLYANRDRRG